MERGRVHPRHSGEQVPEEPLGIPQEGAFALGAPQLLEEREGKDLGVRELLERLVAVTSRVEQRVGVVDEAEQDRDRPFKGCEGGGMLRMGHPRFLSPGIRMAPFYRQTTQHASRYGRALLPESAARSQKKVLSLLSPLSHHPSGPTVTTVTTAKTKRRSPRKQW
jgi:hypothetical protein